MLPEINSFALLGGEKSNYQDPEDPTTDRDAKETDDAFADVAAMTRTACRAFVSFTINGATLTVLDHDSVWGNALADKPTLVKNGAGDVTATWPASVTDARSISHNVNLRRGWGNVEQAGFSAVVKRLSPNTARVLVTSVAAAALTDPSSSSAIVAFLV